MAKKKRNELEPKSAEPMSFEEMKAQLNIGSKQYACSMAFYNKEYSGGSFIYRNGVYSFFCMADDEVSAMVKAKMFAIANMGGWYYSVGNVLEVSSDNKGQFAYIEDKKLIK